MIFVEFSCQIAIDFGRNSFIKYFREKKNGEEPYRKKNFMSIPPLWVAHTLCDIDGSNFDKMQYASFVQIPDRLKFLGIQIYPNGRFL